MKIIHISDLHICALYKKSNIRKIKGLIENAALLKPDHLIITGDISDNSNETDYIILKKILLANNFYCAEKTTVIPGNHDIFGGVQKAEDIIKFPQKCRSVNLPGKLSSFADCFKELYDDSYFPLEERKFPFAKILNNTVLIGLNTTDEYSNLKNPMASNGKVDKIQYNALKEILEGGFFDEHFKIILTHHHFYRSCDEVKSSDSPIWNKIEKFTMKLRGKRKLLTLLKKNGVKMVLHGHSHDFKEYSRKGVRFLNAGGSIENGKRLGAGMFLISIENGEASVEKIHLEPGMMLAEKIPSLL